MKYLKYTISKPVSYGKFDPHALPKDWESMPCTRVPASADVAVAATAASLKPVRNVHFPNDVLFHDFVKTGELERIGRFIRAKKATLDTIYHTGMAAIHEAVLSGNLACVKLLVELGADIHQRDEDGWTPLHMACSDGFPEIAKYLLSLGADVNAKNEDGDKPADLIDPDFSQELAKMFGVEGGD